jgi:type IV pilus assembly protein PilP
MTRFALASLYAAVLSGLLAGCVAESDDLQQWMAEQRRITKPHVKPVSEPKKYVPLSYSEGASFDPFSREKLTLALRRETGPASAGAMLVAPELNRRKEPLEAFPLDVMAMVGSLDKLGQRVALIKVDNLLHQVRAGNYLGQNYGRVNKVSENEVVLREIVQDAAGEWIERNTVLQLQEKVQ